jgi:hypothetical protein
VGSDEVRTLADFYTRVWARGAAGAEVPLQILTGAKVRSVTIRSMERNQYFKASTAY